MDNKAILVIDMPERCDKCVLCDTKDIVMSDDTYGCCTSTGHMVKAKVLCTGFFEIKKPKWCPLKEMPKKINDDGIKTELSGNKWLVHDEYQEGYNKCIDEILGGEE